MRPRAKVRIAGETCHAAPMLMELPLLWFKSTTRGGTMLSWRRTTASAVLRPSVRIRPLSTLLSRILGIEWCFIRTDREGKVDFPLASVGKGYFSLPQSF
mmetsp:Transcript_38607/g.80992  ORF Transcript_38607/g.80992 Transcript_38607/m.80992 type:complete len:100 (-) Transcript_38607:182-481(-)